MDLPLAEHETPNSRFVFRWSFVPTLSMCSTNCTWALDAHMHKQVWWIGVADEKTWFVPFVARIKRFETKIGHFFAKLEIVIALATRYGAYSILPKQTLRHDGREKFRWSHLICQSYYTHPIPTSKESVYWRLVGPTCLMYAGENTGV